MTESNGSRGGPNVYIDRVEEEGGGGMTLLKVFVHAGEYKNADPTVEVSLYSCSGNPTTFKGTSDEGNDIYKAEFNDGEIPSGDYCICARATYVAGMDTHVFRHNGPRAAF